MTEYRILERRGPGWEEVDNIKAASGESAIRKHVEANENAGGTFVAVPARSFTPIRVEVETTQRVKIVAGAHAAAPAPKKDSE